MKPTTEKPGFRENRSKDIKGFSYSLDLRYWLNWGGSNNCATITYSTCTSEHATEHDGGDSYRGVGGSAPGYLEYRQHEKQQHEREGQHLHELINSIRASSKVVRKEYGGSVVLHAIYDIAYIPHDFVLSEPSAEFNKMLKDVLGFEIKSKFLGWKELICQETKKKKKVYIPQYDLKSIPNFSPIKKYLSRKSSVNRLISQIKTIEAIDYVIQIVLTLPKKDIEISEFRSMIKRFIKRVEAELFGNDRLGGYYNIHIWSSKNPMEKHVHAHVLLLNAVETENGLVRFKPFFSKDRLETLKRIWREISGAEDIHISYAPKKDHARFTHLFKYASRHILVDFAYYYAENPYNPEDREKIRELIEYENRRTAFGWCRKLKKFVREKIEDMDSCPICGGGVVVKDEIVKELPTMCMIVFFDWKDRTLKFYDPLLGGGG